MASGVQRSPGVRSLRPTLLVLSVLVAFPLTGCDRDASSDPAMIREGYYDRDGGFVFLPPSTPEDDSGPSQGDTDGGLSTGNSDAGIWQPDGGSTLDPDSGVVDVPDASTPGVSECEPVDCGEMPTSTFPCFDGTNARLECSAYLEGPCTWQYACGL